MKNLTKAFLVLALLSSYYKAAGQSNDSIRFNIYRNYDSDHPPIKIDFNELPSPTLFILNNKKLKGKRYLDLKLNKDKIHSFKLIQNKESLKEMGYSLYESVVIIKSTE